MVAKIPLVVGPPKHASDIHPRFERIFQLNSAGSSPRDGVRVRLPTSGTLLSFELHISQLKSDVSRYIIFLGMTDRLSHD